jgi:hypothetical protein
MFSDLFIIGGAAVVLFGLALVLRLMLKSNRLPTLLILVIPFFIIGFLIYRSPIW